MRAAAFSLLTLVLWISTGPAAAASRAVLVLRPELTADAVFRPRSPFASLLRRAAVGVMNPAVRGPREPASASLTLGAGERLAAGPLAQPARFSEEQVEGDAAAIVYARRLGLPPAPLPQLLQLDWAAYLNSPDPTYTPDEQRAAGGLGQALRPLGGAAWLGVDEAARTRWGALVAMDAAGTVRWAEGIGRSGVQAFGRSGPARDDYDYEHEHEHEHDPNFRTLQRLIGRTPERLNTRTPERLIAAKVAALLRRSPLAVLDLPASFGPSRLAAVLETLASDPERDVLLVSPYPPPGPGGAWDRLPPVVGIGPDFPPGLLTSATTRTPGLVANIDVAPTLLAVLSAVTPRTMSGRVMSSDGARHGREGPAAPAAALRFEREAALSGRAIVPIGVTIEATAVLTLALIVLALRRRTAHPFLVRFASWALLFVGAFPLGLLLGPVTGPTTVLGLGLAVAAWSGAAVLIVVLGSGVAAFYTSGARRCGWDGSGRSDGSDGSVVVGLSTEYLNARTPQRLNSSPLPWLAVLTVMVVTGDLLMGGRLIARSPLSGFPVGGIRFYGVGNEYLGGLVGMGMVAPLAFEAHLARYRWAQAALFLGLLLLIASPRYGANFGGALVGAAGFGALLALAISPRRPLRALLLAAGALVLAGAGAMVWDALRPAATRTHIGDFALAVWREGWPAAAPVLRRKATMDLRILTSGFAVVPLAGVLPLVGLWYRRAGGRVAALLSRRPELRAVAGGALAGAWTGLFFKDSGVAPCMFILGSLFAVVLDEQLRSRERAASEEEGG